MWLNLKNILIILAIVLILKIDFKKKKEKKIFPKKISKKTLLILSAISLIYLIVINIIFVSNFVLYDFKNDSDGIVTKGGLEEKLNIGDSVSIKITRNRWYGQIFVEGTNERLYLFKILPIPLKKGNLNFLITHFMLLAVWAGFIIFSKKEKFIKGEIYK